MRSFLPYFGCDYLAFADFWEHVCDAEMRNRIDAGERQAEVIAEYQTKHPKYAKALAMYFDNWEVALPGEVPGMLELVRELKAQPDTNVYGLTNWSMETFPQARQRFEVLQQIDDYVVSGAVGMVKPDPRIFQLLMDRYGLKAENCTFIDDNPQNVAAAQAMGMRGIVFESAEKLRISLNM